MQVQGQSLAFESPSAFSIYLKRLINPARKADDGWKTVKYGGKFLEHYKVVLARRRFPNGQAGGVHPDVVPERAFITAFPMARLAACPCPHSKPYLTTYGASVVGQMFKPYVYSWLLMPDHDMHHPAGSCGSGLGGCDMMVLTVLIKPCKSLAMIRHVIIPGPP